MLSVLDLNLFTGLQNDAVNTRLEPSVHAYGIILSEPDEISCTSLQNNVINTLLKPPLHAFRIMLSVLTPVHVRLQNKVFNTRYEPPVYTFSGFFSPHLVPHVNAIKIIWSVLDCIPL